MQRIDITFYRSRKNTKCTINCNFVNKTFSDPPLEEDDIPIGQWLCHSCKVAAVSKSTYIFIHNAFINRK